LLEIDSGFKGNLETNIITSPLQAPDCNSDEETHNDSRSSKLQNPESNPEFQLHHCLKERLYAATDSSSRDQKPLAEASAREGRSSRFQSYLEIQKFSLRNTLQCQRSLEV
jgi:hypothetical protein